jgi:hypothetical protein
MDDVIKQMESLVTEIRLLQEILDIKTRQLKQKMADLTTTLDTTTVDILTSL